MSPGLHFALIILGLAAWAFLIVWLFHKAGEYDRRKRDDE